MSKIVLDSVTSGYDLSKVNANFQKIENELNDKVLYRDNPVGEANTLEQDVDANGKTIYNLADPVNNGDAVPKKWVEDQFTGIILAAEVTAVNAANAAAASAAAADISEANALASAQAAALSAIAASNSAGVINGFEWKGTWASATAYVVNNLVYFDGTTYICIAAHTSTLTFDGTKFEVFALEGASGTGAGDLLSTNNLSDLADIPTARSNLGLGNVDNTSDLNKPISTATQTALDAKIDETAATGSAVIPSGTTAQRDVTPQAGYFRFNAELGRFEGFDGSVWGAVGGGATGGTGDEVFFENSQTVTQDYTITAGKNAMSAGPITIADGVTVTIPDGAYWTVV